MKKLLALLMTILLLLSAIPALADMADYNIVTKAETHKVILDTDMGYFGDDTYAMMILLQADKAGYLDLLGLTSVGANTTIAQGTTAILNQLEALGRSDIPVAMGTDIPIMGLKTEAQMAANGLKEIRCMANVRKFGSTISYDNLGELKDETWGYSSLKPVEQKAWEFMIEQVHKYPGQVTIFAIGACTNVALACMMDPTFAENTAGIIYMGGAIDVPGNGNACGEFNWFYDPESVQICLNNDFPYQIVVPHDIAHKVLLAKDVFDMMNEKNNTPITQVFIDRKYPTYLENPTKTGYCWDAITAGIFLCPDLITESEARDLAIDCNRTGYSYANATTWKSGNGPYESKNVEIIFNIDRDAFWTFVTDLYGTKF